jgi:hypothetical protein
MAAGADVQQQQQWPPVIEMDVDVKDAQYVRDPPQYDPGLHPAGDYVQEYSVWWENVDQERLVVPCFGFLYTTSRRYPNVRRPCYLIWREKHRDNTTKTRAWFYLVDEAGMPLRNNITMMVEELHMHEVNGSNTNRYMYVVERLSVQPPPIVKCRGYHLSRDYFKTAAVLPFIDRNSPSWNYAPRECLVLRDLTIAQQQDLYRDIVYSTCHAQPVAQGQSAVCELTDDERQHAELRNAHFLNLSRLMGWTLRDFLQYSVDGLACNYSHRTARKRRHPRDKVEYISMAPFGDLEHQSQDSVRMTPETREDIRFAVRFLLLSQNGLRPLLVLTPDGSMLDHANQRPNQTFYGGLRLPTYQAAQWF